jgi:hypothetical protein
VSLQVFVGPSNIGKTYFLREWWLPMAMTRPELVTDMAPSGGFKAVLIHDPPTMAHPHGQYPGQRFDDVAAWLRAVDKPRLACLERPTFEALCEAGAQIGGLIIVVDELERVLQKGGSRQSPAVMEMLIAGRQHNCVIAAGCKRLVAVPTDARANLETAYFGNLSDQGDREDAAQQTRVDLRVLDGLASSGGPLTQQGTFLEWRRATSWRGLTRVVNRQKVVIQEL